MIIIVGNFLPNECIAEIDMADMRGGDVLFSGEAAPMFERENRLALPSKGYLVIKL